MRIKTCYSFMTSSLSACFSELSFTASSESPAKGAPEGKHKSLVQLTAQLPQQALRPPLQSHPACTVPNWTPISIPAAFPWWLEQALLTVSSNSLSRFNIWLSFPQVHDQVSLLRYALTGTLCRGDMCGDSLTDRTWRKCRVDNLDKSCIQGI